MEFFKADLALGTGRYVAMSQKLTSVDGRLPMAGTFGDTMPAAEVSLGGLKGQDLHRCWLVLGGLTGPP